MTQSSRINLFSSEGSLPPEELGREGRRGCSGTKVIVCDLGSGKSYSSDLMKVQARDYLP